MGVSLVAMVLGVPAAWFVSTCEFPFRKQLEWLLVLPLSIPTFINAIAYSGLTDYAGPVRTFFRNNTPIGDVSIDVMNTWGVVFVMGVVLYPYVYLTARASFINQSGSMVEASRSMGMTMQSTFLRVIVPVSWPAIFSGLSLVVMETLNDYGTVKYYGVPTFTTGIFKSWLSLGDMSSALFLANILGGFILVLIIVEQKARGDRKYAAKQSRQFAGYELGVRKQYLVLLAAILPFLLGFVVPVCQMLWWLSLTYREVVLSTIVPLLWNSVRVAFITAVIVVGVALLYNFSLRLFRASRVLKYLPRIVLMGYAMPGAVIAIGIINVFVEIDSALIYAGLGAMISGYVVRYFAVGHNPLDAGFQKEPISHDEAARLMGSRPWRTLLIVHVPRLKASLAVGLMLVFVDVTKELPLTLILRPFNFETLATNAFQYATDEMAPESAAASLMIVAMGIVPIYLLNKVMKKA